MLKMYRGSSISIWRFWWNLFLSGLENISTLKKMYNNNGWQFSACLKKEIACLKKDFPCLNQKKTQPKKKFACLKKSFAWRNYACLNASKNFCMPKKKFCMP
jgi:hypothetical protein